MFGHDERLALGLMSGTSLDGIDAALLRTDGRGRAHPGARATRAYDAGLRDRLRASLGGRGDVMAVQRDVTMAHAEAVAALLAEAGVAAEEVDVIGFHGHTIVHRPDEAITWQIGDGALLAERTGIDVICDLRSRDVAAGGQGAPLAPLYHAALASPLDRPLALLNLGGVGNVTWLGKDGLGKDGLGEDGLGGDGVIRAFDTGPGNALIDDWVARHGGGRFDADGALARAGTVHADILAGLLDDPYFDRPPPKSLDRDDFAGAVAALDGLSAADGAATLTAFTIAAVVRARDHLAEAPRRWLVGGGGRHNPVLMAGLAAALGVPVEPVEAVGWDGDALEAQAFAYLAVRALDGLSLSLPGTTGAPRPLTGGALHRH